MTTAMLKFMAEFALNKTQRLTFDSSSPNGILLFREVSKVGNGWPQLIPMLLACLPSSEMKHVCVVQVLVIYGTRVLTLPSGNDPYGLKYKGIWICLSILKHALGGNYVNFGVFDLYGDPALKVGAFCCQGPRASQTYGSKA
jgi:exportin-7